MDYRKANWTAAILGFGFLLMESLFGLTWWIWAAGLAFSIYMYSRVENHAFVRRVFRWRGKPNGEIFFEIPLSETLNAESVAELCAPGPKARQYWLTRLSEELRFGLQNIGAGTAMSLEEWAQIVHRMCRGGDQPLPPFFQRVFDHLAERDGED